MIQNRQYNFYISWKNTESYCPPTSYKNNRNPMIQARYTLPLSEANIWVIQENEEQSLVSDRSLNTVSQGKFWSEEFFPASNMTFPCTPGYPKTRNYPLPWEQHRAFAEWAEHGRNPASSYLDSITVPREKTTHPGWRMQKACYRSSRPRADGGHTSSTLWTPSPRLSLFLDSEATA